MKLLREILNSIEEKKKEEVFLQELTLALEHQTYKQIPGTNNSFRQDSENTSSKTQKHAHVYAKRNGEGKELYSVNFDGSGHDGSSGIVIPKKHAEYFRGIGYDIASNLTLESLSFSDLDPEEFSFCYLYEDV